MSFGERDVAKLVAEVRRRRRLLPDNQPGSSLELLRPEPLQPVGVRTVHVRAGLARLA